MDVRLYLKAKQREAEERQAKIKHRIELALCGLSILLIYAEVALAIL